MSAETVPVQRFDVCMLRPEGPPRYVTIWATSGEEAERKANREKPDWRAAFAKPWIDPTCHCDRCVEERRRWTRVPRTKGA